MKILAALSGGVDSAVAAARVVAAGHEVTGVHLALSANPQSFRSGARGCCSLEDSRDARRASDVLGIPFYIWDMAEEFKAGVVEDFLAEYSEGRTPNPCLRCNEKIKFSALLDRALALGFDAVCTGHYAQLVIGSNGVELHRAIDPQKDQSYVLGVLEQWQLERALFPVGDTTKPDIRKEAEQLDLLVAKKPDSHDICFIPDGDTAGFLQSRLGAQPGQIVDALNGEVVGEHQGAHTFTIGQRRGLALGNPADDGKARYVTSIDVKSKTVFVGPPRLLEVNEITGVKPTFTNSEFGVGQTLQVQWRAHGNAVKSLIKEFADGHVVFETEEFLRGVAPGQQAVFYEGDRVVGSVVIDSSRRLNDDN
ncbi:MAG: tRNA 2-thiouridine(34) synthase MnmA [Actinomycetota bacterium]|jgi:tRNA-specific 2-thiouridylase